MKPLNITLTQYEFAVRAELIDQIGMKRADNSLDNGFEVFLWGCYQEGENPAKAAAKWAAKRKPRGRRRTT
jgi:hypothetical protein